MHRMKTGLLPALLLVTGMSVLPAQSQEAALKDFIAGTTAPLSIQMKDLTTEYRRVLVSGQSEMGAWMQMMGMAQGAEPNTYYTKGETVELGGETYLLAYRPQMPFDPRMMNWHGHGEKPIPMKPGRNTRLALSLLNLRTAGSLNEVRPFDPKEDIQTTQEGNAASLRNMTQLGQGVMQYIYNTAGKFPTMGKKVTPELKRAFYPHVHDARTFVHPATEETYTPNPLLSGKRFHDIRNANLVWLFVEANPSDDGSRRVLFADGHVESMDAARWGRVQKIIILMNKPRQAKAVQYYRSKNGRWYYRDSKTNQPIWVVGDPPSQTVTVETTVPVPVSAGAPHTVVVNPPAPMSSSTSTTSTTTVVVDR